MREIKFRAFADGEMIYNAFILQNECSLIISEIITVKGMFSDFKWMQYTGLKDKNGKEIYEGDHFGEPNYPVEFEDGAFFHEGELLRDYCTHMEIKGNIHENKELL